MKESGQKDVCFVSVDAVPESITCPKCGGEIGLWTDSVLTICWFCGYHAFRKEAILN